MKLEVKKLTNESLLREMAGFTIGHDSKITLERAYACGHSIIRTQMFKITMRDIPLFVASQLVRSHVGVQWYQKSKRTDRGGEDFNDVCRNLAFQIRTEHIGHMDNPVGQIAGAYGEYANKIEELPERFDRLAPTDLAALMNAEAIINMSRKRLCAKASKETREIWENVVALIEEVDPDLAKHCIKPCVASCGLCREPKGCGFNKTEMCAKMIVGYKRLFV